MSKYISNAISKMNRKTKTAQKSRVQPTIIPSDDVHRLASRQPQLYKINRVPTAPRIQFGNKFGSSGLA